MSIEVKLRQAGWDTWHHPNYWVHPKTITDENIQDYTNYGMTAAEAWEYEQQDKPPFRPVGAAMKSLLCLYRDV